MEHKRLLLVGMTAAIVLGISGAVVSLYDGSQNLHVAKAGEQPATTLVLNVDNRVENLNWEAATVQYQNGFSTIHYADAHSNEGFHIEIGGNGSIYKEEASNSLASISITKESKGVLLIESDYVPTFNSSAHYEEWMSGTEETFYVVGNYWRIRNVTGDSTSVCINSITITYGCHEASAPIANDAATISGWINSESRYLLQDVDGVTYFTMRGISDSHLLPSQLKIRDDSSNTINCSFVRYRRDSRFEAFFDVDTFYSGHQDYNGDFGVHLLLNDSAWDGQNGDVFARPGENNDSAPFATPAGSVQIVNASWSSANDLKAPAIRFNNDNPQAKNIRVEDNGNGGVDLVITGVGVNANNLGKLGFDLQKTIGDWGYVTFTDTISRQLSSDGTWNIRANLSSVEDCSRGYLIHLLYDGNAAVDMEKVGYRCSEFSASSAGRFSLDIANFFTGRSNVIGLFTSAKTFALDWAADWVYNDNAVVVCWAWGTNIDNAWYSTAYVDNKHVRVYLPTNITGFKLARFSNEYAAVNADWNKKWNQTDDVIVADGTYSYTINWQP